MHHGYRGAQEVHKLHFTLHARSFDDCVEDLLVERKHLLASLQMRSLERNEVSLISERRDKGSGIARAPSLDHPTVDGTDRLFIGGRILRLGRF